MERSHSVDCTITDYEEFCCCEENRYPLSPCSSTDTLISLNSVAMASTSSTNSTTTGSAVLHVQAENTMTVWEPNLVDKRVVTLSEVENYVYDILKERVDITILHFLIYLFATSSEEDREYINQIKLLHAGKQYSIQRMSDLSRRSPLLKDVVSLYSTFQMFRTDELRCPPLKLLVSDLMKQTTSFYAISCQDTSATYAEAIYKMIKKSSSALRTGETKSSKLSDGNHKTLKGALKKVFKIKPQGIVV